MGISSGGGKEGAGAIFTEINITPLTDIFLVLLIIMMVLAPLFQNANKEITVPKLHSGQEVNPDLVTVEIIKEGKYFVAGKEVSADQLQAVLTEDLAKDKEKHINVKADEAVDSGVVLKLFQAASQAGYEKMTIAGEPLQPGRSSELREHASSAGGETPAAPAVEEQTSSDPQQEAPPADVQTPGEGQ